MCKEKHRTLYSLPIQPQSLKVASVKNLVYVRPYFSLHSYKCACVCFPKVDEIFKWDFILYIVLQLAPPNSRSTHCLFDCVWVVRLNELQCVGRGSFHSRLDSARINFLLDNPDLILQKRSAISFFLTYPFLVIQWPWPHSVFTWSLLSSFLMVRWLLQYITLTAASLYSWLPQAGLYMLAVILAFPTTYSVPFQHSAILDRLRMPSFPQLWPNLRSWPWHCTCISSALFALLGYSGPPYPSAQLHICVKPVSSSLCPHPVLRSGDVRLLCK